MRARCVKCRICREPFERQRALQVVCSPPCALELAHRSSTKRAAAADKAERKADADKRSQLKSRSKLIAEAQAAVNRYVRLRDAGLPCISCGRNHAGQWHAGHYRSTRAAPELRFDLDNIHAQCAPCNTHLSGNLVLYRVGLLARIGAERVAMLEGPHEAAKWSREELIELRAHFLTMAKALQQNALP